MSSLSGDKKTDEIVLQPYMYITQASGKEFRSKLANAFNYWLNVPEDTLNKISYVVQLLHNSSLLIDDIQDNSILRRGIPVAHSIYGVGCTINAANYVMMFSLEVLLTLNNPELIKIYTDQILKLHRGQGLELYWRDNMHCPTEEEYKSMVEKKTGGLIMLVLRLMQAYSDDERDLSKLARIIGTYFQIRDDYCNLRSSEYAESKSFAEDLTEGKFSFPIVHAINSHPEDKQIMYILRKRTREINVKRYCVELLEKYGSFAYTRKALSELETKAREEIAAFGGNPLLKSILDALHTWNDD